MQGQLLHFWFNADVMIVGTGHIDYYSKYDKDTFFAIVDLQKRIPKHFVNIDLLNAAIFWFTNVQRRKYGLTLFQFHDKLKQMATLHSEQMRTHSFFDHENKFDSRYKTLKNRMDLMRDGLFNGFMSYAENIADCPVIKANEPFTYSVKDGFVHFYTMDGKEFFPYTYSEMAKSVVDGWMNSPGHRANILNPDYLFLGCGCAPYEQKSDVYSVTYFKLTQNFGGELVSPSIIKTESKQSEPYLIPTGRITQIKQSQTPCLGIGGKVKIITLWQQTKD